MIVLDASVAVELVVDRPRYRDAARDVLRTSAPSVFAPHLIDAEVAQVLRRRVLARALTSTDAALCLQDFTALPIVRHGHLPILARAFELRDNATIYDALYLALAETMGATLVTTDSKLASVPGVRAKVHVLA